jgi:hypothetical protein
MASVCELRKIASLLLWTQFGLGGLSLDRWACRSLHGDEKRSNQFHALVQLVQREITENKAEEH